MKQKLPAFFSASLSFQGLTHLSGVTKLNSLPMSKKTLFFGDGENVGGVSQKNWPGLNFFGKIQPTLGLHDFNLH